MKKTWKSACESIEITLEENGTFTISVEQHWNEYGKIQNIHKAEMLKLYGFLKEVLTPEFLLK